MNHPLKQVLFLGLISLTLAACEGMFGKKDESPEGATVDDGSRGAETRGLDSTGGFAGHALDNPASPLSKRVIYFEYDSSEIGQEYRDIIDAHAQYVSGNPSASVTLEGHADERGSREYNVALGEVRASSVRRLMSLLGASDHQMRTISYGEERPASTGHDEYAWQRNRRVEIEYRDR